MHASSRDHNEADDRLERTTLIRIGNTAIEGTIAVPPYAMGVVIFAHGSGSSRFSPRNRFVARVLRDAGLATLLLDLLSPTEALVDDITRHHRFDVELLADRLAGAIEWLDAQRETAGLSVGLFGAGACGGAALVAAAKRPDRIAAVISRGGRPDLAGRSLAKVEAPTLLIVPEHDDAMIALNQEARAAMQADVRMQIVPGATHLFEERGALERVADLARDWFVAHVARAARRRND
jgi:dienelactone hydrolase